MNTLPIGLFDSGVGGLTVLKALVNLLPDESYLYLGDTARLPYGTKSADTVASYALQATSKLVERNIKLLVVACNTATAAALPALQAAYPKLPVLGVIQPGAMAACAATSHGSIAVIGTEATIRGGAYEKAIHAMRPQVPVLSKACSLFVSLAEEGLTSGPLVEGLVAHYLDDLFAKRRMAGQDVPECLVLGCTHFPLLKEAIAAVAGPGVHLVDSAETTAQAVQESLKRHSLQHKMKNGEAGQCHFLTTDDVERFRRMGENFLGSSLSGHVELVNL